MYIIDVFLIFEPMMMYFFFCGFLMTVMFFFPNIESGTKYSPDSVVLFIQCKALLVAVGAGTFIFHLIDDDDDQSDVGPFNFRLADRFTMMILTCTSICILFFVKLFQVKYETLESQLIFFLVCVYISGLVLAVDYYYSYMLFPLGVILLIAQCKAKGHCCCCCCRVPIGLLWLFFILNLSIWNVNAYIFSFSTRFST